MGSFSTGTTSLVVSDPSPAVTQKTAASYSNHADIPRAGSENSVIGGPTVPIKSKLPPSGTRTPPRVSQKENKSDDKLFEFLNSIPSSKERKPAKPKIFIESSSEVIPKHNETVDLMPNDATDAALKDETSVKGMVDPEIISDVSSPRPNFDEVHSQAVPQENSMESSSGHNRADDHRISNLELENKLLRKEVASLNEEMVSVVQRAKEAEKRVKDTERQLQRNQAQLSTSENIARQLRMKEDDFTEALNAKDSQLAVLRVRVEETDQELQSTRKQIEEFHLERERLLQDHSESTGVHSHALDTLKAKLEETERKLKTSQDSQQKMQQESMDRQSKSQEEQAAMAESLKNMQKKLNEEKSKGNENIAAVKTAKANLETTKQELKDYKDKAARILQAKDKVIASLRDGSKGDVAIGISSSEYEEVCHERDLLKDEVNQYKYKIEQLKADLQVKRTKVASLAVEDLHYAQDEVTANRASFMTQIQERENEIQKLRTQLATKALTSTTEEELENRVRALTENLIQKQTLIEGLSTEKNSLVLQLERLEKQYRDVQASTSKIVPGPSSTYDGFDDMDENTLSRVKSISSIMPSQLNDSRKVKKAVNEIDKFSIRLGHFLRRYPVARLFVIVYMVLLHLWVLVVLLTYQPEIHSTGTNSEERRL
ncbi:PREDICTED: golgin subfamily A member 5-like [Acropora digitifera]|uniref:golgin subfamily A member 5-like n=1 Tax=Acropora digitifera TaxID=70779 RepID=UPI00077A7FAB|nr:PREDICTED: golgin subfamily A member 5-like [Acropora digitifera]